MNLFYQLVKADYLQRTRSYGFLVTMALSLLAAYYFVPSPDAGYSTLRIGAYMGDYNTAWIGHVMAMMSCVFLSILGFYLINNSIRRDINTGVGVITAATHISNFKYLMSKVISNFCVLLSIIGMVIIMALILIAVRGTNYPVDIVQLILPFFLVPLPVMFMIATLAVAAEVIFRKNQILQNIGYFILFCIIMSPSPQADTFDYFGDKYVMNEMISIVHNTIDPTAEGYSIGFNIQSNYKKTTFLFEGIHWSTDFIISRLYIVVGSFTLIFLLSFVFHRFNVRERSRFKKTADPLLAIQSSESVTTPNISMLPEIAKNYSIIPLIRTEIQMLLQKGPRWIWLVNLGLFISLFFAEITTTHMILLPLLWLLQINRWSDIFIKDEICMVHYFSFSSYQPVKRLLTAQIIAAFVTAMIFAMPLILRYIFMGNYLALIGIFLGAMILITTSLFFGILTGGSKLFEVVLLFFTYALFNKVPFADYLGAIDQGVMTRLWLFAMVCGMLFVGYYLRDYKIRHV